MSKHSAINCTTPVCGGRCVTLSGADDADAVTGICEQCGRSYAITVPASVARNEGVGGVAVQHLVHSAVSDADMKARNEAAQAEALTPVPVEPVNIESAQDEQPGG